MGRAGKPTQIEVLVTAVTLIVDVADIAAPAMPLLLEERGLDRKREHSHDDCEDDPACKIHVYRFLSSNAQAAEGTHPSAAHYTALLTPQLQQPAVSRGAYR